MWSSTHIKVCSDMCHLHESSRCLWLLCSTRHTKLCSDQRGTMNRIIKICSNWCIIIKNYQYIFPFMYHDENRWNTLKLMCDHKIWSKYDLICIQWWRIIKEILSRQMVHNIVISYSAVTENTWFYISNDQAAVCTWFTFIGSFHESLVIRARSSSVNSVCVQQNLDKENIKQFVIRTKVSI